MALMNSLVFFLPTCILNQLCLQGPLAAAIRQLYSFLHNSGLTSPIKIQGTTMPDRNVLSSLFALNHLRPQSSVSTTIGTIFSVI